MSLPDEAALAAMLIRAMEIVRRAPPAQSTLKAVQDHVTDVDLAVDAFLAMELAALTPGLPVLSEERAATIAGPVPGWWVVDPVDGTGNLVAGLPFVGIAVALVDARGPHLAAVAALAEASVATASRGAGARLRDADGTVRPLVLPAAPPDLAVLSTGLLDALFADPAGPARFARFRRLAKLRNLGAQSLHVLGVAQGRFAAAASLEARVWDEAAAGLILREAGGLWASAADAGDWSSPAAMMAIPAQRSLAAHPAAAAAMAAALDDLVTPFPDPIPTPDPNRSPLP